ncbi:hypothetical protein [Sideroxyarcus emersonii]|nr:hypothetical protein [Sideroxyarcus emersonii]
MSGIFLSLMANIESTHLMKRIFLIGLMVSVLAGCEDMPLLGGEGEGDDFAATSQHKSLDHGLSQLPQKLPIKH